MDQRTAIPRLLLEKVLKSEKNCLPPNDNNHAEMVNNKKNQIEKSKKVHPTQQMVLSGKKENLQQKNNFHVVPTLVPILNLFPSCSTDILDPLSLDQSGKVPNSEISSIYIKSEPNSSVTTETFPPVIQEDQSSEKKASMQCMQKSWHPCRDCGKKFTCKNALKTHFIRNHADDLLFSCKECGQEFRFWGGFTDHMKKSHGLEVGRDNQPELQLRKKKGQNFTEEEISKIGTAEKREVSEKPEETRQIPLEQLPRKRRKRNPEPTNKDLTCKICDLQLARPEGLRLHIIRMHSQESSLPCPQCDKSYKVQKDLNSHMNRVHKKLKTRKTQEIFPKTEKNKEAGCSEKKSTERKEKTIRTQEVSLEAEKDDEAGCSERKSKKLKLKFSDSEGIEETQEDSSRIQNVKESDLPPVKKKRAGRAKSSSYFNCEICGKNFVRKPSLDDHIVRVHTKEFYFSCEKCGKEFKLEKDLFQHQKELHPTNSSGEPQEFICKICGIKVARKDTLRIHHIRKHSLEFNFPCKHCDKTFKIQGDLTTHTRLRHLEPPAVCEVCGKVLKNKHSLYIHQKYTHFKPKFACPICNNRMVSQENLDLHIESYHAVKERVTCEDCGKTFASRNTLKDHIINVHSDVRTNCCHVCGKSFARYFRLRQHLLTHTSIKPYICDICGKQFKQKPSLMQHRKTHPGDHPPLPIIRLDTLLGDLNPKLNQN